MPAPISPAIRQRRTCCSLTVRMMTIMMGEQGRICLAFVSGYRSATV